MPGYGFAKAAKSEKFDFNQMVGDYLEQRDNLRRVFVLIDSRHEPQRIDLDFISWLGGVGRPFSLIFTKADKQSPAKTRANVALFQQAIAPSIGAEIEALVSSAKTRDGRTHVLRVIDDALRR